MGEVTEIEWCDHTFNPWIGCTKVSPACDHCYAEQMMDTRYSRVRWGTGQPRHRTAHANWRKPLTWNRAAAAAGTRPFVFAASLADVFDNEVDPAWRRDLYDVIRATPNLCWLLLTKRPQNIIKMSAPAGGLPPNVALGCTVVLQKELARDAQVLARAKRELSPEFAFLSVEPLLEAMDITAVEAVRCLDWVIVGGESGRQARPMDLDWARRIRDDCRTLGVVFNFKQLGARIGHGPNTLDGVRHFDRPTVKPVGQAGALGPPSAPRPRVQRTKMPKIDWERVPETNPVAMDMIRIKRWTEQVCDGTRAAAFISGGPGAGKTKHIKDALAAVRQRGFHPVISNPHDYRDLLKDFRRANGKRPVILEEADQVLRSVRMINILKVATDPDGHGVFEDQQLGKINMRAPVLLATNADMTDPMAFPREVRDHLAALRSRSTPLLICRDRMALWEYSCYLAVCCGMIRTNTTRSRDLSVANQNAALAWFTEHVWTLDEVSPRRLKSIADTFARYRADEGKLIESDLQMFLCPGASHSGAATLPAPVIVPPVRPVDVKAPPASVAAALTPKNGIAPKLRVKHGQEPMKEVTPAAVLAAVKASPGVSLKRLHSMFRVPRDHEREFLVFLTQGPLAGLLKITEQSAALFFEAA